MITGLKSQSIALNEQKIHPGHLPGLLGTSGTVFFNGKNLKYVYTNTDKNSRGGN
jgi:uncharacterized Fe-S radical SAM superfamily protein PflX